jgi:hypothetical protein
VADAAHALHRIHARHRTDRTREETAAFSGGVAGAATTQTHPAPTPEATPEAFPAATPEATPEPTSDPTPTPEPIERAATPTPTPAAPPTRRPRRRRAVLLLLAILAALAIVVGLGTFLLDNDPAADTTDPSARSDRSASGETNQDEGSASDGGADQSGSSSPEAFVEDYYAVLPDDTQTGWSMLSPGFQSEIGSYGDYDGFWSTIDAVTVEDVQSAGPGAVDTTLVYTTDGSSQSEVRRIELTRSGDSYLISGDEIVG